MLFDTLRLGTTVNGDLPEEVYTKTAVRKKSFQKAHSSSSTILMPALRSLGRLAISEQTHRVHARSEQQRDLSLMERG